MKTDIIPILCMSIALLSLPACSDKKEPEPAPVTTASSPEPEPVQSQQQATVPLLKSTHANFSAQLPCKDCPGIDLDLSLQRNEHNGNSFVLHYQRMERDSTPAVLSGDWIVEASQIDKRPAAVITLNPGNSSRRALLRINNDNSLTLVEGSLNGVGSDTRPVFDFNGGKLDLRALYEEKLFQANPR